MESKPTNRVRLVSDVEDPDAGVMCVIASSRKNAKYMWLRESMTERYIDVRCKMFKKPVTMDLSTERYPEIEEIMKDGVYSSVSEQHCQQCNQFFEWISLREDGKYVCDDCY